MPNHKPVESYKITTDILFKLNILIKYSIAHKAFKPLGQFHTVKNSPTIGFPIRQTNAHSQSGVGS